MRILVDENTAGAVVAELRRRGHDVIWVATDMPGARDEDIAARARRERRVVVTNDLGYGRRAVLGQLPSGVLLIRLGPQRPLVLARRVADVLGRMGPGELLILTPGRLRRRRLPRSGA